MLSNAIANGPNESFGKRHVKVGYCRLRLDKTYIKRCGASHEFAFLSSFGEPVRSKLSCRVIVGVVAPNPVLENQPSDSPPLNRCAASDCDHGNRNVRTFSYFDKR